MGNRTGRTRRCDFATQRVVEAFHMVLLREIGEHSRVLDTGDGLLKARSASTLGGHEKPGCGSATRAGPMGMVKLFVRTGVEVVEDVYTAYQAKLAELGMQGKSISVAIVHHANYKINKLKEKHLQNEGIVMAMPTPNTIPTSCSEAW